MTAFTKFMIFLSLIAIAWFGTGAAGVHINHSILALLAFFGYLGYVRYIERGVDDDGQ